MLGLGGAAGILVNAYAVWSRDTSYLGTGFWHRYPLVAMWMFFSFFLGILWIVVAAVFLWVRRGRAIRDEKVQLALITLLILAAYASEYWADAILLP